MSFLPIAKYSHIPIALNNKKVSRDEQGVISR